MNKIWEKLLHHDNYELDIEWINISILDGVFTPDPTMTYSTSIILKHFPNIKDKDVLDIGCGTWVIGIRCIMGWARSVLFSDINEKALENTRENLKNNGINENISVIYSDLFENIPQRFDCIFANLPISNEVFKLGERTENIALKFLNESKEHINANGKIYLARWSFENIEPLIDTIKKLGYWYNIVEEYKLWYTWYLIEITIT